VTEEYVPEGVSPVVLTTKVKCLNICSVNFLFFELSCEILCERNFFFIVFRKLEVVRC
jgi:hypothetical protein